MTRSHTLFIQEVGCLVKEFYDRKWITVLFLCSPNEWPIGLGECAALAFLLNLYIFPISGLSLHIAYSVNRPIYEKEREVTETLATAMRLVYGIIV